MKGCLGSRIRNKIQSAVLQGIAIQSDINLIYEISNKSTDHINKLESKLNALQKHLKIEIIEKVILDTNHKVIEVKE